MRQRRILQGFSVAILGLAMACAPMAVASGKAKPKHKHHPTKPATKKGFDPTNSNCLAITHATSSSGNVGTAIEKSIAEAATNFAAAKGAMIAAINDSLKEASVAEADLRSAPNNVQNAMKGIYAFVEQYKTAIANSSSIEQLGLSIGTLAKNSKIESDALILSNYFASVCGTSTPTT
jgi:hypothetical protein